MRKIESGGRRHVAGKNRSLRSNRFGPKVGRRWRLGLVAAALAAVSPWGHATTNAFTGGAANPADQDRWEVAANWSLLSVPTADHDVWLGDFSVRLASFASVRGLSSGAAGALEVIGGRLLYTEPSSVGSLLHRDGRIEGPSPLTLTGSGRLAGGTHSGIGTTLVGQGSGDYSMYAPYFDQGRVLRNAGQFTQEPIGETAGPVFYARNTGNAKFINEGTFNIATGSVRAVPFGAGNGVVSPDMVTNTGTIRKTTTGVFIFDVLDQRGQLDIAEGTLRLDNQAVLRSGSHSGGAGWFEMRGNRLDVESGASTSHLNMSHFSGRLEYTGTLSLARLNHQGGVIAGSGEFVILESGRLAGGTHSGTGTTLVGQGSGAYTMFQTSFDQGRVLRNVGQFTQEPIGQNAGPVFYARNTGNAKFINEGTFNIATGSVRALPFGAGNGVVGPDMVTNTGTIRKTTSGSFIFDVLDQRGQLDIAEGTLGFDNQAVLRSGSVRVADGAVLDFRAQRTFSQLGGDTDVEGTLRLSNLFTARFEVSGGGIGGTGRFEDVHYNGVTDFALVQTGGSLNPGGANAVGLFTIAAGLDQQAGAVLDVDLLSLASYDQLSITRFSRLGGVLNVDALDPGLALSVGDSFLIATLSAGYSGTFSSVFSDDLFNGQVVGFSARYLPNAVELVVDSLSPVPEPDMWALLLAGGLAVATVAQRRRQPRST